VYFEATKTHIDESIVRDATKAAIAIDTSKAADVTDARKALNQLNAEERQRIDHNLSVIGRYAGVVPRTAIIVGQQPKLDARTAAVLRNIDIDQLKATHAALTQQVVAAHLLQSAIAKSPNLAAEAVKDLWKPDVKEASQIVADASTLLRDADWMKRTYSEEVRSVLGGDTGPAITNAVLTNVLSHVVPKELVSAKNNLSGSLSLLTGAASKEINNTFKQAVEAWDPKQWTSPQNNARLNDAVSRLHEKGAALASNLGGAATVLDAVGLKGASHILREGQAATEAITGLATALATSNPVGIVFGVANLIGLGGGLGAGDSDNSASAVLAAIAELDAKLTKYHIEEMEALHEIQGQIIDLTSMTQSGFENVASWNREILTNIQAVAWAPSDTCAQDLQNLLDKVGNVNSADGYSRMAAIFNVSVASPWIATCLHTMQGLINPVTATCSVKFELFVPPSEETKSNETRAKENPALWYTQAYGANVTSRERAFAELVIPQRTIGDVVGLSSESIDKWWNSENDPLAHRLALTRCTRGRSLPEPYRFADKGRMDVDRVMAATQLAMGFAAWRQLMTADGRLLTEQRPATEDERRAAIDDAKDLLSTAKALVEVEIGQTQLLSGQRVFAEAAQTLISDVLPAYFAARRTGDTGALCEKLHVAGDPDCVSKSDSGAKAKTATESLQEKKGREDRENELRRTCSTPNKSFDTLCLMQADPEFAENTLQVLAGKLVERAKGSELTYRLALIGDDDSALFRGPDNVVVIKRDVLSEGAPIGPHWWIELPRVANFRPATANRAPSTQNNTTRDPVSECWNDVDAVRVDGHPEMWGDPVSAHCYLLPTTTQSWRIPVASDRLAALLEWNATLQDAIDGLDNPRPPEVSRAAAFAMVLRDRKTASASAKDTPTPAESAARIH